MRHLLIQAEDGACFSTADAFLAEAMSGIAGISSIQSKSVHFCTELHHG